MKKTERVEIRLSKRERSKLRKLAKKWNMSVSEYIRYVINTAWE